EALNLQEWSEPLDEHPSFATGNPNKADVIQFVLPLKPRDRSFPINELNLRSKPRVPRLSWYVRES
ncbi:MAG: hypothetical protein MK098_14070, partial [Marinovum sp.]|nr:hypothetical protein [Marinovum sp.]